MFKQFIKSYFKVLGIGLLCCSLGTGVVLLLYYLFMANHPLCALAMVFLIFVGVFAWIDADVTHQMERERKMSERR